MLVSFFMCARTDEEAEGGARRRPLFQFALRFRRVADNRQVLGGALALSTVGRIQQMESEKPQQAQEAALAAAADRLAETIAKKLRRFRSSPIDR